MSIQSPGPRPDLFPASEQQMVEMERLAYGLLEPEPIETSRSYGLISADGNQAMIEVVWDELPNGEVGPDTVSIVCSDSSREQVFVCGFNQHNDQILTSYRDDAELTVVSIVDDLLGVEHDVEDVREVLRFFQIMMLVAIGLEDEATLRMVGGMEGNETHIADKMRALVMSKSIATRRTRSYQRPIEGETEATIEVFDNRIDGIDDVTEVEGIPVLSIELTRRAQDQAWRYARYPDDDRLLEQYTPTLEIDADDDVCEYDDPELEELEDSMRTPLAGDVRRLTKALTKCRAFEITVDPPAPQ